MTRSCSLTCSLPMCQMDQGEQTKLSKGLRITVIALGIIALIVGILVICGVQGISQWGAASGWTVSCCALLSIALAASLKGIKKHSIDYYEFKEIDHQALQAVASRDVYTTLFGYLTNACEALNDLGSDLEHFNDQVWALALYKMMLEGHLDEEGCHAILHIGDFSIMDAESIEDGLAIIYTTDWFSKSDAPCFPATLKKAILGLSQEQQTELSEALQGKQQTDSQVVKVMNLVIDMAATLQKRYPFSLTAETIFLPQMIYTHIKKVILELQIDHEDDLDDYEILQKICALVAIKLLSHARVAEEEQSLYFGPLKLEFNMIDRDFLDPKIPNFLTNELTSFDNDDEPVCHTQPLELAILLNRMDEAEKANLVKAIEEGQNLDREIALLINPIGNLLLKRYLMKFMQVYKRTSSSVSIKVPISQRELHYSLATNKTPQSNIGHYELEEVINIFFKKSKNHFRPEGNNCVLAAILQSIEPKIDYYKNQEEGNLRIKQMRHAMADYLVANEDRFIGYFKNQDMFIRHVKKVRSIDKLLEAIDLEILALVIDHPLCIYAKDAASFFVNEKGEPIPYVFGRECSGEPIFLLDTDYHYDLLIRK